MAEKNKSIKMLMIVGNILIWGFAIIKLGPIIFGDGDASPAPVTQSAQQTSQSRTSGGLRNSDTPDKEPSRVLPWQAANLIPFFEAIADPFRPVLAQDQPAQTLAVKRQARNVVDFQPPRGDDVRKKPVMTIYRLSSIVRIGDNTLALLAAGVGRATQTVSAKAGDSLPDGSRLREINFQDKYVILVKDGHVFKLVDYAPWVMLLHRPE